MIAGLVHEALAASRERDKTIEVVRIRITDAGRDALAEWNSKIDVACVDVHHLFFREMKSKLKRPRTPLLTNVRAAFVPHIPSAQSSLASCHTASCASWAKRYVDQGEEL
jgi:hypothetical protein